MKEIKLTQGKITLIDDEDFVYLSQWTWRAIKGARIWYAVTSLAATRMHRLIMNTPDNLVVDHKDGDGLNNQKYNLRNCTQSQNIQNMQDRGGYQGVDYVNRDARYRSAITYNGIQIYLGYFKNSRDAAKAYNIAALKYYGVEAKLNTIREED